MAVDPVRTLSLRRRVKRLGWLSVALFGLTVLMLAVAALEAAGVRTVHVVGELPVGSRGVIPAVPLIVAAIAGSAGLFILLAALHAAAAMRVLSRDRRIPPPMSPESRRLRDLGLVPVARLDAPVATDPLVPPTKLVEPSKTHLRLAVLVPAHTMRASRSQPPCGRSGVRHARRKR